MPNNERGVLVAVTGAAVCPVKPVGKEVSTPAAAKRSADTLVWLDNERSFGNTFAIAVA